MICIGNLEKLEGIQGYSEDDQEFSNWESQ